MHLYEERTQFRFRGIMISIAFFLLLALVFWASLGQVESKTDGQQAQLLEDTLRRASVTCYAIEGRYPPSLSYIKTYYSVVIDEDKYLVLYSAFAPNIMPTITVQARGASLS